MEMELIQNNKINMSFRVVTMWIYYLITITISWGFRMETVRS